MKKSTKSLIGFVVLILGVLTLGVDRIFVSASTEGSYWQSTTAWTVAGLALLLVGAVWVFRTVRE